MIFFRKYWMISFLTIWCNCGFGQIFGGNPPSLKWKQINTPLARIIFPAGLDSTAERITNIITFISKPLQKTIGFTSKKINLVVQNQTIISNAYVGLGPYRSEFLITPDQNSFELGSLPWPDQLTIHEYRHVQQYNNFNTGLSKVLHNIFGDEGQALANNAAIPNWFFEGDAVYNETNVSRQGRGNLPFFYNGYRSLWIEHKRYSWMKLRNGSLKDFVPNHYPLGFLLVAYGREKYGDTFWKNVTHDAASFKRLFYPFQSAIKKYAGVDYVTFRNDAFNFFKKEFNIDSTITKKEDGNRLYVDEQYPAYTGTDTIIFVKSGYRQIPEFILKTENSETKIRIKDYSLDNHYSYKNGKIIYAAYRPDTRCGYRDYNDLEILNITNGKQYTLTHHTKYFSPDISEDGKTVVAVRVNTNATSALDILNAATGAVFKILPNPLGLLYTYPKFYNDKIISPVRNTEGKMSLAMIDKEDGKPDYLIPFTYNVLAFPCILNDTVYFSCSYKKNDELFAYTFADKKLWRLVYTTPYLVGKYQPAVTDESITWSSFTAEGYKLVTVKKNEIRFEEVTKENFNDAHSFFGVTSLQKTNFNLLQHVPDDSFTITKYPKSFKLFNFHSIEPAASDPEYSLALISENILNTLQSQVAFTYNRAEKFKRFAFTSVYGGLFPFLSAGINFTFDRKSFYNGRQVYFNELEPFAGFNIPLNFSKGRSFTFFNFGSQYVYNQTNYKGVYKDTLSKLSYGYSSNFLSFTRQAQKAIQQIFPAFAQSLSLSYKVPVSHKKGFQFTASGNIYLPGFLKTHSIVVDGAYLRKDSLKEINFSSGFSFSRGYSSINLYKMYKWGIDYHLPLLYPDAGFGNILYLLRVRGNVFYDYTHAMDFFSNGNKFSANFRSAGAEINFDTRWWNEALVTIGFRYSRLFDTDLFGGSGANRYEIILPVNIFNK